MSFISCLEAATSLTKGRMGKGDLENTFLGDLGVKYMIEIKYRRYIKHMIEIKYMGYIKYVIEIKYMRYIKYMIEIKFLYKTEI